MSKTLTTYQAKYFAYELTKKCASNDIEKFSSTLLDAKVELNPHQIEAALFAFKNPLSKGALLADEVGLGKTIEAGIVLSQKWATGNKRILIICPSSLRKQWMNELFEKFYLPSEVLETKLFNKKLKTGSKNPFDEKEKIIICSYHFAKNKAEYLQLISWDLIVLDEAHFLRNVYKNSNIIATEIRNAIQPFNKILLSATPLQTKLEELYGLVSFIDENVFGDLRSFRRNFTRGFEEENLNDLSNRISQVCHRTLRRDVVEYISYTERLPITIPFEPTNEEQELYDNVTSYIRQEISYGIPTAQRHLIESVLRKLLASSTFAISATLLSIIKRLKKLLESLDKSNEEFENDIDEVYELYDEEAEVWDEELNENETVFTEDEKLAINEEINTLEEYYNKAVSIKHNAKGDKLMIALETGFGKLKELGAKQKAIVFTESTRTQKYLFEILQETKYKDKIALFNGSNNNEKSKQIYKNWVSDKNNVNKVTGSKSVDIRNAIVDEFNSDRCQILIATEAASEGINLQFCSMVVNYDLPWNPQKIEQRIGRCHRYGQKYNVVVINFLNTKNETDVRVFELLTERFSLFSGVFGSSDEVLGIIGNGIDFEKSLMEIFKKCKTKEEIDASFKKLQNDLHEQINTKISETKDKLFQNFDAAVIRKLKTTDENTKTFISRYEHWLWQLSKFILKDKTTFNDIDLTFKLNNNFYTLNKKLEQFVHYRINSELAQNVLLNAKNLDTESSAFIKFDYTNYNQTYNEIEKLKSKKGMLNFTFLTFNSAVEDLDILTFTCFTYSNETLNDDVCKFLLALPAQIIEENVEIEQQKFAQKKEEQIKKQILFVERNDVKIYQFENKKFNKWAKDKIESSEKEIVDVKKEIQQIERDMNVEDINADTLLKLDEKKGKLERKKSKLRRNIFDVEDQINDERDRLKEEAKKKLKREIKEKNIFTIKWEIV